MKKHVLALLLLLCCAVGAKAQGALGQGVVTNSRGLPVGGALIAVCTTGATEGTATTPCSPLVTLYTDQTLLHVAQNPFVSDGLGNYSFWAPSGYYQVQFYGSLVNLAMFPAVLPCTPGGMTSSCSSNFPPLTATEVGVGSSSNTLTGFPTLTYNSTTGNLKVPAINNIIYVDGVKNMTVAAALSIANATGNTTIVVTSPQTIPSGLTISNSNIVLKCENGAVLSKSGNFDLVSITGNYDVIDSCILDGSVGSFSGGNVTATGTTGLTIRNSISRNSGGAGSIYLSGATNTLLQNNRVYGFTFGGIFGEKNTNHAIVQGNFVDGSSSTSTAFSAIAFHGTTSGQTASDIKIEGNDILSTPVFCVEVGAFGGSNSTQIVVSGNTCRLSQSADGGFSVGAGAQYYTINGNTCDANGFPASIACYEVSAGASDVTVFANIAHLPSGAGVPILVSGSDEERISVNSNIINGFPVTHVINSAIQFSTSFASGTLSNNTIQNNTINFPTGAAGYGIWIQCNNASATCNGNSVSGNKIVSDGTAASYGVVIEDDSATSVANTFIGVNSLTSPSTGILIGMGVTNTRLVDGVNTAATPITDNGTGTGYSFAELADGCGQIASKLLTSTTVPCGSGSGGVNVTVNGGANLPTPVNLQNGGAVTGISVNFSNPSTGNVQAAITGTLTDAGLASAYSGVGTAGSHQFATVLTRNAAPTFAQPTLADIAAGVAPTGTFDFSGVTLFKGRVGAGLTTTVNGDFGYDTTNKNWHFWENAGDRLAGIWASTPTNGNCVSAQVSSSVVTLVDAGAPCATGSTASWATITAGTNSNSGTFTSTGNTWDFSGVTLFKGRVGSTLTTTVNGDFGYDTTNKNWHFWTNGIDEVAGMFASQPTNGNCVKAVVAASVVTLADFGATCGGTPPTIQTNGVSNSTQTTLNHINSTVNAVGLTATFSNPTGGNEKLEITGGSYSGTAALATAAAGTPGLCSAGQGATGISSSFNAAGCTTYAQIAGDLGNTGASPQVTSTHLSSPLPVGQGGLGLANPTAHFVVIGNGTSAVGLANPSTTGFCLTSNGAAADPTFQACTATGANTALSNLASVAVNSALLPGTDNSISLDSLAKRYVNGWFSGVLGYTNGSGTADTGISRDSAGVIDIGNGTAGDSSGTAKAAAYATSGTNGGITGTEGTGAGLTPSTSVDIFWADSTGQRFAMNNHNVGKTYVVGEATSGVAGNVPKYASNGYDIVDSGVGPGGFSGLTTNTIPVATSSTTIGNSSITDNGSIASGEPAAFGTGTIAVYTSQGANQNVEIGSGNGSGDDGGTGTVTVQNPNLSGKILTNTNCANGAAPAVCSAASVGAVAVPTGINPTLTINTTAITSTSRVFLAVDESLTISGVTCNTTISTLVQPVVTARTAGTSFTIQIGSTLATNPACVSYFIVN